MSEKEDKIYFMQDKKSSKRIKKRKTSFFFFKFCRIIQNDRIDLPTKKMARCQAFIIALALSAPSFGQGFTSIGTDVAETAESGKVRIIVSHAFSDRWTSEASASFRITADQEGYRCFTGEGYSEQELSFRYWAREHHIGASVSLGIVGGFNQSPDMKIGAGYDIPLWKGFHINIGYGLKLLDTLRNKGRSIRSISIELHYRL